MLYDLIIVGGGIAGLSAAFQAQKLGLKFLLLESADRIGGCINSTLLDGQFVFERGPNSFAIGKTLNEMIEGLKLQKLVPNAKAKKKLIFAKDKLQEASNPLHLFGSNFLSGNSKLALITEAFRRSSPATLSEESLETFFARKFTQEVVDLLIWPLLNGIYAGDPGKLSLQSVFPKLYEAERKHKTLIGGLLAESFQNKDKQKLKKLIYSFDKGLNVLVEALGQSFEKSIQLNSAVKSIAKNETSFLVNKANGETLEAKKVILALPSYTAANLHEELLAGLREINYAPVITLMVWGQKGLNAKIDNLIESSFGFLTARNQKIQLLGTVCNSALFTGRAPENKHALNCFLGGVKQTHHMQLSDEELSKICQNDLAFVTGLEPNNFEVKAIQRWSKAIPQYEIGHKKRIDDVFSKLPSGLKLAGNYLRGISLEDTALSGKRAVQELFEENE